MAYMALYESTIDWLKTYSPDCFRDDIVKRPDTVIFVPGRIR
jgi:hypothetical protein